jgi:hypothetical protein
MQGEDNVKALRCRLEELQSALNVETPRYKRCAMWCEANTQIVLRRGHSMQRVPRKRIVRCSFSVMQREHTLEQIRYGEYQMQKG